VLSLLVIVQYWLVLRAAARLPDNWPEVTASEMMAAAAHHQEESGCLLPNDRA
jgi:hypothetical protein